MRQSRTIAAMLVVATLVSACGRNEHDTDAFCNQVSDVLNVPSWPAYGGDLVESLRGVETAPLAADEASDFGAALATLDERIEAFRDGTSHDGWSTAQLIQIVRRICGSELASYTVVP